MDIGLSWLGDPEGFYRLEPDLQVDLLAYWNLTHHIPPKARESGRAYVPSLEDLRLLLTRPVTSGDLAWLWSKVQPKAPSKPSDFYIEPEARTEDLNAQIAALFVHHPKGET